MIQKPVDWGESVYNDTQEVTNAAALPATWIESVIYVTLDDNKLFRWDWAAYVEVSSSVSLSAADIKSLYESVADRVVVDTAGNILWGAWDINTIYVASDIGFIYMWTIASGFIQINEDNNNVSAYADFASLPVTWANNVVYITIDTANLYTWDWAAYKAVWGTTAVAKNTFHYDNINKTVEDISWINVLQENANTLHMDANYIYVWKNNASRDIARYDLDWTNELILTNAPAQGNAFWPMVSDWTYLYFRNATTDFVRKIAIDWSDGLTSTQVWAVKFTHELFLIGTTLYAASNVAWITKIETNWTWQLTISASLTYSMVIVWSTIYFRKSDWKIYSVWTNWTWETLFLDTYVDDKGQSIMSDWTYLYYSKWASWLWKYPIAWGSEEQIYSQNIYYTTIYLYWDTIVVNKTYNRDWVVFINKDTWIVTNIWGEWFFYYWFNWTWDILLYPANSNYDFFLLNIDNPVWYSYSDSLYESQVIENNSQKIAIKAYNNLPIGTSFDFEIANLKESWIIVPQWEVNDICCGRFTDFSWTHDFTTELTVWQTATLSNWNTSEDIIITLINVNRFNFTPDVFCCTGWIEVSALVANFTAIPTVSLNWSTEIDLDTVFWTTTNDLYYKINLASTDNLKAPMVNIVEILK